MIKENFLPCDEQLSNSGWFNTQKKRYLRKVLQITEDVNMGCLLQQKIQGLEMKLLGENLK